METYETEVSAQDKAHLQLIRDNVSKFITQALQQHVKKGLLLEVGPQNYSDVLSHCPKGVTRHTFDIDKNSGCTIIGDICIRNKQIKDGAYDYVVFTEVMEHLRKPFKAIDEIARILKPGGYLFLSVPFNFRIHGPLPDCFRFTEYGLQSMLEDDFEIVSLNALETPDRTLMPIHYTVVAKRK